VGVSAATGEGMAKLFTSIDASAVEFNETYLPDLMRKIAEKSTLDKQKQSSDLRRLQEVCD
jgi:hypothetical protein